MLMVTVDTSFCKATYSQKTFELILFHYRDGLDIYIVFGRFILHGGY